MVDEAVIDWSPDGAPRSRRFDDVYFSTADGLAETREVFLRGCGLPDAWAGRARFTVAELGLGTGLNVLALLDLWRSHHDAGQRLHIFSVEAYPMTRAEMLRALDAWPELADLAGLLAPAWPGARGFHRLDLPGLDAVLDVAVMEAAEALEAWTGRADAWFLDGFAPARNPQMWRDEVLAGVARRSAPGARAATFTVAGAVRDGLARHGFAVERRPGFGAKRQRLEAWRPLSATAADATRPPRVCIVGAGVAGASLARAFQAMGVQPTVVEAQRVGAGASGNPAALVTPRFDAGGGVAAQLHAQAFRRAAVLYRMLQPDAVIGAGALQLEAAPRDQARFDRIAASDLFEAGALERLSPDAAERRLGEPVDAGGIWIRDGLTIAPGVVLPAWLEGCELRIARVAGLEPHDGGWRVLDPDGGLICEADAVCVAAACDSRDLIEGLTLGPVRGQVSIVRTGRRPTAAAWGGYVIPTNEGLLYGATHDRGQTSLEPSDEDHQRNLAQLARKRPALAEALARRAPTGRVGLRAATPDHLPLAGAVDGADGLFVLAGLGGRGYTLAPLLAEHVAAMVMGAPSPLPAASIQALAPGRFSARSARGRQPAGQLTGPRLTGP